MLLLVFYRISDPPYTEVIVIDVVYLRVRTLTSKAGKQTTTSHQWGYRVGAAGAHWQAVGPQEPADLRRSSDRLSPWPKAQGRPEAAFGCLPHTPPLRYNDTTASPPV